MNLVERKTDEFGPDIEFIRLTQHTANSVRTRRSFYNLSKEIEARKTKAMSPVGFSLISGFPDETKREHAGQYGFKAVTEHCGFGMITGVDKRFEKEGFDYLELGASYSSPDEPPNDFRGVSGAGVWQFLVCKNANEPMSQARYHDFVLMGVAYYQTSVENGVRHIRAHGQHTLYDFMNKKAAEWAARQ